MALEVLARVAASELASSNPVPTDYKRSTTRTTCSLEALLLPHSSTPLMDKATSCSTSGSLCVSPIEYLEGLFTRHGIRFTGRRRGLSKSAIPRPSFEELDAYSQETALAVRQGNLVKLKELYYEKGFSLGACNRFGESLLHLSCRRGHAKMVEFMATEAMVNPRVMDDGGRTAFHDCCWSSQPNLDTMDVLLKVLPPIGLLVQDCRGHTPLQYAPRKHWPIWLQYLQDREPIFVEWIRTKKEQAAARRLQGQNQGPAPPPPPRVVE